MKLKIVTLLMIALGGWAYGQNLSTKELSRQLGSPNAKERLLAMENLTAELKRSLSPSAASKAVIPAEEVFALLQKGVSDSNEEVRVESLRGMFVMTLDRSATAQVSKSLLDEAKAPLTGLLEGSNPELRASSIAIYSELFEVSNADKKQWMALFNGEQSNLVKKAILNGMLKDTPPTVEAVRFVIGQIGNPSNAYDATMAIMAHVEPPPDLALAPIVNAFSDSPDPGKRDLLARALQRYGGAALPYLQLIIQMRDRETDPAIKRNLNLAVEKVSANQTSLLATSNTVSESTTTPAIAIGTPRPSASPTPTVALEKTFSSSFPIISLVILGVLIAGAVVFFLRR